MKLIKKINNKIINFYKLLLTYNTNLLIGCKFAINILIIKVNLKKYTNLHTYCIKNIL